MDNIDLSIVIPAYNEGLRIEDSLKNINNHFNQKELNFEIIVVDDGSIDDTVPKALSLKDALGAPVSVLKEKENRGKGHALKRGFEVARGEFILFTDTDLSTPLKEFDKMMPLLRNGYDVVMGSRRLPDSKIAVHQSVWREFFGKVFYKIVFTFLIKGISDTNCGFKGYTKKAGKHLYANLTVERWGFDTEIIYLAQKYGYKIKEVPVEWHNKSDSKVNIVSAACDTLVEIAKIKFNDWRGNYS